METFTENKDKEDSNISSKDTMTRKILTVYTNFSLCRCLGQTGTQYFLVMKML